MRRRSRWHRWGAHVTRHPWAYVGGGTAVLLALAAPVLALRLGTPDEGSLPPSRTERRAYDLVAEGFGPGINGPLVIAVDISEDPSVVEALRAAIAADEGIAAVAPPEVDTAAGVATLIAFPTTSPQDGATLATIDRLRADVLPSVLDGSRRPGPRRRPDRHLGGHRRPGQPTGCRCSSAPSSCCRSCCSWWCSDRCSSR